MHKLSRSEAILKEPCKQTPQQMWQMGSALWAHRMSPETRSASKQHKSEAQQNPAKNLRSFNSVGGTPAEKGENFREETDTALVEGLIIGSYSWQPEWPSLIIKGLSGKNGPLLDSPKEAEKILQVKSHQLNKHKTLFFWWKKSQKEVQEITSAWRTANCQCLPFLSKL